MRLSEAPDKTPPPRKEREHGRPMRYGNAVLRGSCYCRNGDRLLRSQSKFRLSSFSSATSTQQSIGSLNAATRFPSRCGRRQSWSWRAARQERPASEDLESHAKQMQLPRDETAISFLISSSPFSLAGTWDGPGRAGLHRFPILVPRKAGPGLLHQTRVPFMAGPDRVWSHL